VLDRRQAPGGAARAARDDGHELPFPKALLPDDRVSAEAVATYAQPAWEVNAQARLAELFRAGDREHVTRSRGAMYRTGPLELARQAPPRDSLAAVVVLERARLDVVLVGEREAETHLGLIARDVALADLVELIGAQVVHRLARPDLDALSVERRVLAHRSRLL